MTSRMAVNSTVESCFLERPLKAGPAKTSAAKGKQNAYSGRLCDPAGCARAIGATVEIERVTFAVLAPGIALAGENVQVASFGSPEQDSETGLANDPPRGATLRGKSAVCPAETVSDPADDVKPKSVRSTATTCVLADGAPVAVALSIKLKGPAGELRALTTLTVTLTGFAAVGLTTAAGAKLQVTPVTGALHASETVPLKVPAAVT